MEANEKKGKGSNSNDLKRELQASEARLRNIIEKNADSVIIVDRNGLVHFVNPAVEALFGRKAENFLGESFGFPVVAGETKELGIIRRDGKTATGEMRVVEIEWEGKSAFLASIRDITERKQAEEALAASKAYTESIIRNFLDTLIVVDTDAKIQTVNPATCHLLGYTEEELIGKPVSIIFAEEEEELVILEDITERKHAEEILARQAQREQQEKEFHSLERLSDISGNLRSIAEQMGFLKAGPRDVVEIHSTALQRKTRDVPSAKARAYLEEGRMIVLELMGYLSSFYRNYSLGGMRVYSPEEKKEARK